MTIPRFKIFLLVIIVIISLSLCGLSLGHMLDDGLSSVLVIELLVSSVVAIASQAALMRASELPSDRQIRRALENRSGPWSVESVEEIVGDHLARQAKDLQGAFSRLRREESGGELRREELGEVLVKMIRKVVFSRGELILRDPDEFLAWTCTLAVAFRASLGARIKTQGWLLGRPKIFVQIREGIEKHEINLGVRVFFTASGEENALEELFQHERNRDY